MNLNPAVLVLALSLPLAGCGNKGPLILPQNPPTDEAAPLLSMPPPDDAPVPVDAVPEERVPPPVPPADDATVPPPPPASGNGNG